MNTLVSLIEHLQKICILKKKTVIDAFISIDRRDFVPHALSDFAYDDVPLPIGNGQTISQPYTVAFMLELLDVHRGEKILDVGSGSGYTTALLAELVGARGRVIGIEIVPELTAMGNCNLHKYNFAHAEIRQAGDVLGLPEECPYDKILVSATIAELPMDLVQQLKSGGRMVIPIGNTIWKIEKHTDTSLKIEKYPGFTFVPLIENG